MCDTEWPPEETWWDRLYRNMEGIERKIQRPDISPNKREKLEWLLRHLQRVANKTREHPIAREWQEDHIRGLLRASD